MKADNSIEATWASIEPDPRSTQGQRMIEIAFVSLTPGSIAD